MSVGRFAIRSKVEERLIECAVVSGLLRPVTPPSDWSVVVKPV